MILHDIVTEAGQLIAALESAPKGLGWGVRDRIGRRKRWYELPEEVDQ